ncbi:hypothetical protein [Nonomuraea sp. NPDC049695]|uniref:hypothetical protein n=1 Tax=Nonomuraea sp. NPDC049695 TaxID=3154734 RepID=UPI00343F80C1
METPLLVGQHGGRPLDGRLHIRERAAQFLLIVDVIVDVPLIGRLLLLLGGGRVQLGGAQRATPVL